MGQWLGEGEGVTLRTIGVAAVHRRLVEGLAAVLTAPVRFHVHGLCVDGVEFPRFGPSLAITDWGVLGLPKNTGVVAMKGDREMAIFIGPPTLGLV